MSLRFRLNLLVSLLSLAILALGTWLVIYNARQAVFEEIHSAANLTLQLLDVAAGPAGQTAASATGAELVARLAALDEIRHLRIVPAERGAEAGSAALGGGPGQAAAPAWLPPRLGPPKVAVQLPVG